MSISWIKFLLVLTAMTLASPCIAADAATDRFAISLGAFITDRHTRTRVDSNTHEQGTSIKFEDDLGLQSSHTVFRIDGHYRFAERHRLDFTVFDFSRDSTLTIDESIRYGDDIFAVDTSVHTDFNMVIYKLGYTYSFLHSDKGFLGSDIGLYVADLDVTLNAPMNDPVEKNSLTAPLPVIGLRGEYYLNDRLTLSGDFEWFGLEIDDVRGRLVDFYIATDYRVMDNLALGVAYNYVSSDIDYTSDAHNSSLEWRYNGILLYFKMAFGSIGGSGRQ